MKKMLQNKSSWSLTVRDVAYIGIMIATLEAAKLSLSFIPNVELVTFLLILYTLAFGKKVLYAAFAFVGVECLIWGMGIWVIMYLYIWPLLCVLTLFLKKQRSAWFWAVYHGIAHVYDPKNDERVLYHVAYDATVKAGIDTDKIKIKIEKEAKKVTVTLPEVQIQDIDVDMGTLDYMFESKRSQTESVSKDAYQAAIADVTKECKDNEEIKDLAKENAKNVVKGVLGTLLAQQEEAYTLEVK